MLGCGCLLAMVAAFAPRLVLIIMWIFGWRVKAAFDTFIVPLLGLIFLPYTTIMYVLVWSPGVGLAGWDWLWVLLGVALDVMKWGQIFHKRKEIPGYPGESERAMTAAGPRIEGAGEPLSAEAEAEIENLEELRDKGEITPEEYLAKKREIEGLQ